MRKVEIFVKCSNRGRPIWSSLNFKLVEQKSLPPRLKKYKGYVPEQLKPAIRRKRAALRVR